MGFFTDAVLSTCDKGIDVESMAIGQIEYCSIKAMLRMGEETKDDGVNPIVTQIKDDREGAKRFVLTANGKSFNLVVNNNRLYNSQVRLERMM